MWASVESADGLGLPDEPVQRLCSPHLAQQRPHPAHTQQYTLQCTRIHANHFSKRSTCTSDEKNTFFQCCGSGSGRSLFVGIQNRILQSSSKKVRKPWFRLFMKKPYKNFFLLASWKPQTKRGKEPDGIRIRKSGGTNSRIRIRTKMLRIHNTASSQNEVTQTFLHMIMPHIWSSFSEGKWENLAYCKCLAASLYWNTCHGRAGGSCSASPAHSSSSAQDLTKI